MSTYVVGEPPEQVTFELHESTNSPGTYVGITSTDYLVTVLIGTMGLSFVTPISIAFAQAIADVIYAQAYPH